MDKNLYIDASHPNETRIVLKSGSSIEEYEFEDKNNLNFKNNIYLATISRVEPSLQAAFVNFGRERHGFLAFNDIQSDYYQLPSEDKEKIREVEEKIRIDLTTKDVIHSFKLPELRVGQDAIPGMSIPIHFEATMTSDQFLVEMEGTPREGKGLEIACAQLCGLGHYRMKGYLSIDTEDQYNDWLAVQAEYLLEDNEEDEWGDEEDW